MNDGMGGDVYSEIDSEIINNKPLYTTHTTTAPTVEGSTYIFQLRAYNINGVAISETSAFVLASISETPTVAPTSDLTKSSFEQLKISYPAVGDNGGTAILSYSLEIDDGMGGAFTSLYGDSVDTMSLNTLYKNVTRGLLYRARYRAKNVIGWSSYSPTGFILAASIPEAPDQAEYNGATDSTISLIINKAIDNGGAPISSHELWIDDGLQGSYVQITSYDQSFTFIID
jgi:hypothetical protein